MRGTVALPKLSLCSKRTPAVTNTRGPQGLMLERDADVVARGGNRGAGQRVTQAPRVRRPSRRAPSRRACRRAPSSRCRPPGSWRGGAADSVRLSIREIGELERRRASFERRRVRGIEQQVGRRLVRHREPIGGPLAERARRLIERHAHRRRRAAGSRRRDPAARMRSGRARRSCPVRPVRRTAAWRRSRAPHRRSRRAWCCGTDCSAPRCRSSDRRRRRSSRRVRSSRRYPPIRGPYENEPPSNRTRPSGRGDAPRRVNSCSTPVIASDP